MPASAPSLRQCVRTAAWFAFPSPTGCRGVFGRLPRCLGLMRPPRAFIVFRGTPGDVKVDGRVKVAVDDQSALVADVYAFLEGQFGFHRPAVRAYLAAWIPTVDDVESCAG